MGSRRGTWSSALILDTIYACPQFTDGQDLIRSTFHTRIRTQALHAIVDDPKSFATSASRLSAFAEFIGYKPATEETVAHYDRFAAPILYDKWEGSVVLEHLFRGPILLKVR